MQHYLNYLILCFTHELQDSEETFLTVTSSYWIYYREGFHISDLIYEPFGKSSTKNREMSVNEVNITVPLCGQSNKRVFY